MEDSTPAVPAAPAPTQGSTAASEATETRTRFDTAVEFLLETFHSTKTLSRARKPNAYAVPRVDRFVAASSAASSAASRSANALPSKKTPQGQKQLYSYQLAGQEMELKPEQTNPASISDRLSSSGTSTALPPSARAWQLTLLNLQRATIENCWTGDWHTPLGLEHPPTLTTYQTYLEHQEILGALGLAYVFLLLLTVDRYVREKAKFFAKSMSDQDQSLLDTIRASLEAIEVKLEETLNDELVDFTRSTAEMILRKVWAKSSKGRELKKLLKELSGDVKGLETHTKEVLSRLADVKPVLVFIWGVKAMREALPIWWSLTHGQQSDETETGRCHESHGNIPDLRRDQYSLPSEVLTEVSQGVILIEVALKQFVVTCAQHRKMLKEFKEVHVPEESDAATDGSTSDLQSDEEPSEEAGVSRECWKWMEKRCGEVRALCDVLEGYPEAVKDAYRTFGTFREEQMSSVADFDQLLSSDHGA
ncbi:hypothetical protein QBC37DRAFT_396864 [Rhypophila decipiens]|uniref:Uncharacterized protein n=1 Tax=Rhypophila decipiens TaxID=261697 RepID=A0AAN7BDM9_9PEZI|nr:hypothetical protein QBC37DRAFT_396864 [Rhypophila decipiens]